MQALSELQVACRGGQLSLRGLCNLANVCTGEERKLEVRGLFYGIGHTPNSGLVEGQVELDDKGYVKASTMIPRAAVLPS